MFSPVEHKTDIEDFNYTNQLSDPLKKLSKYLECNRNKNSLLLNSHLTKGPLTTYYIN